MFKLSFEDINREKLISSITNDQAGALVVFDGWVRNHNEGKGVSSLEYQVYPELALREGQKILSEAKEKFNLIDIVCTHRYGHLQVRDIAICIAAVSVHRDDAFKAARFVIDEIKHRLPIWKKEHYISEEAKWVFCKDHLHHVHFSEEEFYQKQEKLIRRESLSHKKVLVVGAGGLGHPVVTGLTLAGVGEITIVDHDKIEISNIHRQPMFTPNLVGERKATVLKQRMMELNPHVKVYGHVDYISEENIERYLETSDLVIDCTDNLRTKHLIHDACLLAGKTLITASIYQYEGQIRTLDFSAGCLRCHQDTHTGHDQAIGNCNDYGVLGVTVQTLGSLQAQEAIFYLTEQSNNSIEQTLLLNLKSLNILKLKNTRKESCQYCDKNFVIKENPFEISIEKVKENNYKVIDIRDLKDDIASEYMNLKTPVVLMCHKGQRSLQLTEQLRAKGYHHFYSLRGGYCSY